MKPSEMLQALLTQHGHGTTTKLAKAVGRSYENIRKWAREGRGFDSQLPQSRANRRDTAKFFKLPLDYFEPGAEEEQEPAPLQVDDSDPYPSRTAFIAVTRLLEDERKHLLSLWYGTGDPGESEWRARLKSYQALKQRVGEKPPKNLARATGRVRRVGAK